MQVSNQKFAHMTVLTVYFTTWRAYGIYPLPNLWQQFHPKQDIRWRVCPPFLLLCLKWIRRSPCETCRRLYDDAWRKKRKHRCPPQLWTLRRRNRLQSSPPKIAGGPVQRYIRCRSTVSKLTPRNSRQVFDWWSVPVACRLHPTVQSQPTAWQITDSWQSWGGWDGELGNGKWRCKTCTFV